MYIHGNVSRQFSRVWVWIGLAILAVGLLPVWLLLTGYRLPGSSGVLLIFTPFVVVVGIVVLATWGAHRWGAGRSLAEDMGVVQPSFNEESSFTDVIRRPPRPKD